MSFWDNVLGGAPAPAPQRFEVTTPPLQQQPRYTYQQPGGASQSYTQGYQQPVEDPAVESAKRKASSSRSTLTCPNCFSDNVCKPSANIMEQCYNCGWNPRFDQQAAGVQSSGGEGPAHPSRQVSTTNNFNPQTIVAKVGG